MGVKHTVDLTRQQAESRLRSHFPEEIYGAIQTSVDNALATMDNSRLEHLLEKLNDIDHGGEGYENYRIVEAPIQE